MDTGSQLLAPLPDDLAPWHRRDRRLFDAAVEEARKAAPHLVDLADEWLKRMPRKPFASQSIRAVTRDPSSGPLLLPDAITCPWIGPNTAEAINALAVDVDHEDVIECREQLAAVPGAPIPDIMIDPWSGRAHVVLRLADPVPTREGAEPKPQQTADYALRLLAAAFRGTPMPQTGLVKSPWGRASALIGTRLRRGPRPSVPARWAAYEESLASGSDLMWITIPGTGPAELRDILRTLVPLVGFDATSPRKARPARKDRGFPSALGRNCELFDLVRWWAYDHADEASFEAILAEAERINGSGIFARPLAASDVRATARSIARFMRERYRPRPAADDDRRGRDREAGADLAPAARKALAGARTAEVRAAATDTKIAAAVGQLRAAGTPLTQAAIAAAAGLSLRTVKGRWHQTMVQDAALSGGAALCAAVRGEPSTESTGGRATEADRLRVRPTEGDTLWTPVDGGQPVLAEVARRDRAVRRAVAALAVAAEAARRPGAEPGVLPEVPRAVAADPAVRAARRDAEVAQADARRRAIARAARAEAAARRAEMEARLREDPAAAWRWWRAELADLDIEWDARESAADSRVMAAVRTQREAVIGGRWRSWKAAVRAIRGTRRDPEVPW